MHGSDCPQPSIDAPFAQVEWLFAERAKRYSNKSSISNYKGACVHFVAFLKASNAPTPFHIHRDLDVAILIRFKAYLEVANPVRTKGVLTSNSITGILSATRGVLNDGFQYGLIAEEVINAPSAAVPETEQSAAYSEQEQSQVNLAIAKELEYVNAVLRGYQRKGEGQDPRIRGSGGWKLEANMRWFFENEMNCRAQAIPNSADRGLISFAAAAANYHGGIHGLYRLWGVTAQIDSQIVMPLLMKLISVTGLNPNSAESLRIDCYQEAHPLTGMPSIAYFKARSGGEKELHLGLLDQPEKLALKRKQADIVRQVVENVLQLTSQLRSKLAATSPLKHRLFICESGRPGAAGQIIGFTNKIQHHYCRALRSKHKLLADGGGELQVSLVRFRPTLLTEMARAGRDFFEIQQVAGHKKIATTIGYVNRRVLNAAATKEVTAALEQIHQNRQEFSANTSSLANASFSPLVKPFKGLVADCKNAFDPPEFVRRSAEYLAGQPCTRFNMCLFCKNVIVMREHLPMLIQYQLQIRAALGNNILNLPHSAIYEKQLAILDQLLSAESSEFTQADLEFAQELALASDKMIDPLIYQAVVT